MYPYVLAFLSASLFFVGLHSQATIFNCGGFACNDTVLTCPLGSNCEVRCPTFVACDYTVLVCPSSNCTVKCTGVLSCLNFEFNLTGNSNLTVKFEGYSAGLYSKVSAPSGTGYINMTSWDKLGGGEMDWQPYGPCNALSGCFEVDCLTPVGVTSCLTAPTGSYAQRRAVANIALWIASFRKEHIRVDNAVIRIGGAMRMLIMSEDIVIDANLPVRCLTAINRALVANSTLLPPVVKFNDRIMEILTDEAWWSNTLSGQFGVTLNNSFVEFGIMLSPNVLFGPTSATFEVTVIDQKVKDVFLPAMWVSFRPILDAEIKNFALALSSVPEECANITNVPNYSNFTISPKVASLETGGTSLQSACFNPFHPTALDCLPPAPFFGACCINGTWRTSLQSIIIFPEYLSTSSPVNISGSSSVGEVRFVLNSSTLNVQNVSQYNMTEVTLSNSNLTTNGLVLIDSSLAGSDYSISVSSNLVLRGTTAMNPSDSAQIVVNGCVNVTGTLKVKEDFRPNMTLLTASCRIGQFQSVVIGGNDKDFCVVEERLAQSSLMLAFRVDYCPPRTEGSVLFPMPLVALAMLKFGLF